MRAYRKTTQHPFCLYLTADEAARLTDELVGLLMPTKVGEFPTADRALHKLTYLLANPDKERA
jgi:hypothetical protein